MGGPAREGGLMGMPRCAPQVTVGTDVAPTADRAGAMSGAVLTSVGRKGAAGDETGTARSQGWGFGVAQQSPFMGAISDPAAMPLQQHEAVPSQAIRKAAAAWPVRLTISSPATIRHMTGLRLKNGFLIRNGSQTATKFLPFCQVRFPDTAISLLVFLRMRLAIRVMLALVAAAG